MIAGQVHAVIAAGLKDPDQLVRWKQDPDSLRQYGVDPDTVDLEALWKFAGLTTKVRHNGLRAELPATFRLMNVAGMEIEVFGAYTTFHSGKSLGPTTEARCDDLVHFLEKWLDFDKREHVLLWDLIRHELALAKFRKCATTNRVSAKTESGPRPSSVPHVCGYMVLHEMRSDPREVEELLKKKKPRLELIPLDSFYFAYWRFDGEHIYVLDLDALSFSILSGINGKRSVAALSEVLGASRRPPQILLSAFANLATLGIITFDG